MNIVVLDGYSANPGDLSWDALKEARIRLLHVAIHNVRSFLTGHPQNVV